MTMVKALREMVRNGDAVVVIGRYWADIMLKNGVYSNFGFENEQVVDGFIDLIRQYKIADDDNSDFSADGTYKIGRKTVNIYHTYPYLI